MNDKKTVNKRFFERSPKSASLQSRRLANATANDTRMDGKSWIARQTNRIPEGNIANSEMEVRSGKIKSKLGEEKIRMANSEGNCPGGGSSEEKLISISTRGTAG